MVLDVWRWWCVSLLPWPQLADMGTVGLCSVYGPVGCSWTTWYVFVALKFPRSQSTLPTLFLTDAGEKQNDTSSWTSCRLHVRSSASSSSSSSSSSSNPLWSRRELEMKNESSLSGLGEGRIRSGLAPSLCRHSNATPAVLPEYSWGLFSGPPECDVWMLSSYQF